MEVLQLFLLQLQVEQNIVCQICQLLKFSGKCDGATCTPIAACMTDPTSAACTGTYGGATTLPSVVAGKTQLQTMKMTIDLINDIQENVTVQLVHLWLHV